MDYHALQKKLFDIQPTDPAQEKANMIAALQGGQPQESVQETVSLVQESVEVQKGTMPIDRDYSVSDFAALAGIKLTEAPIAPAVAPDANKVGMGAKQVGNKLGAKGGAGMMSKALGKVAQGGALPANLSKQIAPFAAQLEVILGDPGLRNKFMAIVKAAEAVSKKNAAVAPAQPVERTLTKGEEAKKEKNVKGMKKNKDDFKKRYGKDAEAVMYATATKNAKKESFIKDELYRRLAEYEFKSTKK